MRSVCLAPSGDALMHIMYAVYWLLLFLLFFSSFRRFFRQITHGPPPPQRKREVLAVLDSEIICEKWEKVRNMMTLLLLVVCAYKNNGAAFSRIACRLQFHPSSKLTALE